VVELVVSQEEVQLEQEVLVVEVQEVDQGHVEVLLLNLITQLIQDQLLVMQEVMVHLKNQVAVEVQVEQVQMLVVLAQVVEVDLEKMLILLLLNHYLIQEYSLVVVVQVVHQIQVLQQMVVVVEDTLVQHLMKKDNQEQITQVVVAVVEEEILQEDVVVQEVQVSLLLNIQVQLEQLVAVLTLHAELLDTYLQVQVIWLFQDIYKIDTLLRLKYKI
jgi:hypothetical protein